ncbi:NAD(P)/FAD-dependent oxidoreductase [Fibrisoma montanum]|uniref:NAD(P)/FAD-dependent oxidoreductase n=1 Tax=Fibrisoma montanum TaxID=2305895 RepID=A0A418MDZ2_9BACT|nr:NAD(P)/FAD-dependent oxidoreductase [Fibrisoma montanum]RIV25012.1 NAD(P)/FAD-dependent oxidoreductase [Fibrisoma montanum]
MSAVPFPSDEKPLDVLIVGAGLSGIGTACWLQTECPDKQYAILEARDTIGGTWDLFRYPGIRSDSDMHTLGYVFKPWSKPKAIADGESIRQYIEETAREYGVTQHIHFGYKVVAAAWSSEQACWTLEAEHRATGDRHTVRARFLCMCSGYYSYEEAYRPTFAGENDFEGLIVLPQFWPKDLDYTGKRVVVVGSGATAVTLVPAMASSAAHVTMLQRSPTYIVALPSQDTVAQGLRRLLPERMAYGLTRWKNLTLSMLTFRIARGLPAFTRQRIVRMAAEQLGPDYAVDTHFRPRYNPWDQRLCVVPDGDLFQAIREGKASVVTDEIDQFTPTGLKLRSGEELPADVVVLATGLTIKLLGGMQLTVDGQVCQANQLMMYKGMMLSDVPNFAIAFGYTNASWTLKTDLTAGYVCRLLRYMDQHNHAIAVPRREADVQPQPLLNFTSGYVQRAGSVLPQQGSRRPWQVYQNYLQDMLTIRFGRINDGVMQFGPAGGLP